MHARTHVRRFDHLVECLYPILPLRVLGRERGGLLLEGGRVVLGVGQIQLSLLHLGLARLVQLLRPRQRLLHACESELQLLELALGLLGLPMRLLQSARRVAHRVAHLVLELLVEIGLELRPQVGLLHLRRGSLRRQLDFEGRGLRLELVVHRPRVGV